MFSLRTLIVFLSVAYVHINADPTNCNIPLNATEAVQCCDLPIIFTAADRDACDFKIDMSNMLDLQTMLNTTCDPLICLLKKNNLMESDKEIDIEAAKEYLKKFGETEKEWSEVASLANEDCFDQELEKFRPAGVCKPIHYSYCIAVKGFMNCPESHWKASDYCKEVATYIADCH